MKIAVLVDWCESDIHPRVGLTDDLGFKPVLCVRVAGISLCAFCVNFGFVEALSAKLARRGDQVTSDHLHLFAYFPESDHIADPEERSINDLAAHLFQAFCFAHERKLDREHAVEAIQAIRTAEDLIRGRR